MPVFNVDSDRWCPSFFSRYSTRKLVHDLDAVSGEQSAERLLQFARRGSSPSILIATTDAAARFVANYTPALREHFLFPPQSADLVHALLSKKRTFQLARRYRLPTPATFFPSSRAEFSQSRERFDFPFMVKGIRGDLWTRASKSKVLVRSFEQFRELCDLIPDAVIPELMVQEYIAGKEDTVWMFNGYFDRDSECRAAFTGRKLRQCPAYTGAASLAIAEKNEVIENSSICFMKKLGYSGIVDIDFRYDSRDGRYKILDVNPRIGSTFRLFVDESGMDVARAMYLDLTGQRIPNSTMPAGRKWIVEDLDFAASLSYAHENSLSVIDWLESLRGIDELSFLAWDDPAPAALMLLADVREVFSRGRSSARRIPPFEMKSTRAVAERQPCL